jgi:hypothetical protein
MNWEGFVLPDSWRAAREVFNIQGVSFCRRWISIRIILCKGKKLYSFIGDQ